MKIKNVLCLLLIVSLGMFFAGGCAKTAKPDTSYSKENILSILNNSGNLGTKGSLFEIDIKEIVDIKKNDSLEYPLDVYAVVAYPQMGPDFVHKILFVNPTTRTVSKYSKDW